jgi:hypothetical protein
MKSLLRAAAFAAILFCATRAHALGFEMKVKVTCYAPSNTKYSVVKLVRAGDGLLSDILGVPASEAHQFVIVNFPSSGQTLVESRCTGNLAKVITDAGSCKEAVADGRDPVKYAKVCDSALQDWATASIDGRLVCTAQGKTTTPDGPISAKGACTGTFTINSGEICSIEGSYGRVFAPKGSCP